MSRKAKVLVEDKNTIIEPSAKIAEKAENGTAAQSLAKQLADNARSRLTEITRDQQSLEQSIAAKQVQCDELEDAADQAEEDHQRASRHLQHIESRLNKEHVRVQVASGTPAEQECLATLATLQEDLDSAKKAADQATRIRDGSMKALEQVPAIQDDIAHHQVTLGELSNLQRELEEIYEEQWQLYGQERQELARQRVEEAKQELERRKQAITGELADWPDLSEELQRSFRDPVKENPGRVEEIKEAPAMEGESSDPTIRLMEAWLRFVEAVRRDGQAANKNRLRGNGLSLFNVIALTEGRLHHFATTGHWRQIRKRDESGRESWHWSTPEFSSIEVLLDKERERHLGWQYQRRDF